MQALPFALSQLTDDLLRATIRLKQVTHEHWTIDWDRFALVCKHGVAVSCWWALASPAPTLGDLVARRHDTSRMLPSRRWLRNSGINTRNTAVPNAN